VIAGTVLVANVALLFVPDVRPTGTQTAERHAAKI